MRLDPAVVAIQGTSAPDGESRPSASPPPALPPTSDDVKEAFG
jgi:hypothetical protein